MIRARGPSDADEFPVARGSVWWVDLPEPQGSAPGFRRPAVVVQGDAFNRTRLRTIVVVVMTSNLKLADLPGNVLVPGREAGLPLDSVANVTQVVTLDRTALGEPCGRLDRARMARIDAGLRLVLDL